MEANNLYVDIPLPKRHLYLVRPQEPCDLRQGAQFSAGRCVDCGNWVPAATWELKHRCWACLMETHLDHSDFRC